MEPLPDSEHLLASAARFLIDGSEEGSASVLLSCSMEVFESGDTWYSGDEQMDADRIGLAGPRVAYDVLSVQKDPVRLAVERAIAAVLPDNYYIKHFTVRAELIDI